jgi:hypothetical protein
VPASKSHATFTNELECDIDEAARNLDKHIRPTLLSGLDKHSEFQDVLSPRLHQRPLIARP